MITRRPSAKSETSVSGTGRDGSGRDGSDEAALAGRVGVREVRLHRSSGRGQVQRLDPAAYRCSRLAAEFADEWVEYVEATTITPAASTRYRYAVERFCRAVDDDLGESAEAMDLQNPGLVRALIRWERQLPASYPPGSRAPAHLAGLLRGLIVRRDDHPDRFVADEVVRFVRGPRLVAWGESSELDEFSRHDKRVVVRAAWAAVNALQQRLATGWQLAEQGQHPERGSWLHLPDLLWGVSRQVVGPSELHAHLPQLVDWPAELRTPIQPPGVAVAPRNVARKLGSWLVAQLYPTTLDLHAFRILLMDVTGLAAEEVTSFGEKDVEFLPKGVRLTVIKKRAGRIRYRAFRDNQSQNAGLGLNNGGLSAKDLEDLVEGSRVGKLIEHSVADQPRREASVIVRRLIEVTAKVREQTPQIDDSLFVRAAVHSNNAVVFDRWNPHGAKVRFSVWLDVMGITVTGQPHIGRLRKSTKVEKAIFARGRVGIAADDHTEQTFAGHYAQGTTLRVISGEVIITAQRHWFERAVVAPTASGPTVVTADAEAAMRSAAGDPAALQALGLKSGQAEAIVSGQLDMGLSHCADPYDSPFSAAGALCSVAPLRCLECRNAWVVPSHLPQLLLFEHHLDTVRRRMSPARFTAIWGQTYTNLKALLADRSDQEKTVARSHIKAGRAKLNLPLAAHQEFDR